MMALDDDLPGQVETLAGALADGFGGEEGIEDPLADGVWDAAAGVGDADLASVAVATGRHGDRTPAPFLRAVTDGVGGIDHQVQDHLVEFPDVAGGRWQVW